MTAERRKTFEQQAETAKPMSWMDTAARLAPLIGGLGVMGAGAVARVQRDRRDVAEGRAMMGQLQQNIRDAAVHRRQAQEAARREQERAARVRHDLFWAYMAGRPQVGEVNVNAVQRGLVALTPSWAGRRERGTERYRNELRDAEL